MHIGEFTRGEGRFIETPYVPTPERSTRRYPLLLTTGRAVSQYNVGAQTRRTANVIWQSEDVLDIHEADAQLRGVADGSWVELASRVGKTRMRARISERVPPGVVYTTFHFPVSGANVVTTEYSDWATNCPEYKVTAVEVRPTLQAGGAASAQDLGLEEVRVEVHEDATATLVRMANEITSNCSHLHQLAAIEAVATHLRMYWTPQMIADLTAHAVAHPEDLQDVALVALGELPAAMAT